MDQCKDCKWYRKAYSQGRCHFDPLPIEKEDDGFCSHFEATVKDKPKKEPKAAKNKKGNKKP